MHEQGSWIAMLTVWQDYLFVIGDEVFVDLVRMNVTVSQKNAHFGSDLWKTMLTGNATFEAKKHMVVRVRYC